MKAVEQQQPNSMDSTESVGSSSGQGGEYAYRPLTTKHRRAGSTGTTGDEEYTTDEDELYADETDCAGPHPILKSDLARAATDLFGYAAKDEEPTSLFDEDEKKFGFNGYLKSSAKAPSPFTYNEDFPRDIPTIAAQVRQHALPNLEDLHEDLSVLKSTNPFYKPQTSVTSSQTSSKSQHGSDSPTKPLPEFQMCKRPSDLKLPSRQTIESIDASTASEESPFPEISQLSTTVLPKSESPESLAKLAGCQVAKNNLNPFSSSDAFHEGTISSETQDLIKSEVESQARQELDPARVANNGPPSPTTLQWGRAVVEVKEHAVAKLQDELRRAHEELKLKDEQVTRLSRIRQDVETELEDLTASLFQEAHNMVREANVRQATAERLLAESRMKSEVLAAEVAALKTLVLTSTPARPNPHLHPQIDTRGREETQGGLFAKKHRRSPSHFNLKYGRENSPPESPVKEQRPSLPTEAPESRDGMEVDPIVHKEFIQWKASPCVDKADPFINRIFREDIDLCLDFSNRELGAKVRQAVLDGIVFIEAVSDKTKVAFPKKCALLEAPRQCHYRMRLGDQENQWHCISQICRNRIIAVCDFLNYLRYIERGLVKSSVHDIYWEITRLRKEMVLARLGLALSS